MKTKTNAQRPTLNAERSTAAAAEKRSIAAHKANWTRSLRRAYPDGGPTLATALPAELDREQCLRAMRRTDLHIEAQEQALAHLRAKQLRRLRELEQIEIRLHDQRKERAA